MDEQIQEGITGNANPIPEGGNQEASVPGAEQQPAEPEGDLGDLPEEVSDRTRKEFEKLKKHNLEMAAKLRGYEQKEVGNSVFDSLNGQVESRPAQPAANFPNLSQGQVNQIAQNFVDDYGNVDVARLNAALAQANRVAEDAKRRAMETEQRLLKAEERRQIAEAHAKFHWLDPKSDQFDKKGFELVRDRLVRNMVEGKETTLADVAEEFDALIKPKVDVAEEKTKAVEDYKKQQTTKQQVGAVSGGKGQPREVLSSDELRARSLVGDTDAINARIAAATK